MLYFTKQKEGRRWYGLCKQTLLSYLQAISNQLTLMRLTEASWLLPKALSTCFPLIPKVHRPCRMGSLKPASSANCWSMCRGFGSPFSLYKAARSLLVSSSSAASGALEGIALLATASGFRRFGLHGCIRNIIGEAFLKWVSHQEDSLLRGKTRQVEESMIIKELYETLLALSLTT